MPETRRRSGPRWGRVALTLAVLALHLLLLDDVARSRWGEGAGHRLPARIEVAFVRELAQAAPPAEAPSPAAAAPVPPRLPAVARQAARPASAPADAAAPAEPASAAEASVVAEPPLPMASAPAAAAVPPVAAASAPPAAPAPVATAASAPAAAASATAAASPAVPASAPATRFDWPPSTQLSFTLLGNYRGPVQGSARVEWLRDGSRYQVRMESSAGPLFRRTGVSEGELGDRGLAPRRFSGEQRVMFGSVRRWQITFGPERVVLTDGREAPAMAGAQDEASQYVQLTWLFTMQPERLRVGQSVEIPLAIGRKLERWTYDVVEEERLRLPFGEVPSFHIKPRREAGGGDLTAEIWIAPTLQYLPVRILLRQSAEVWVDLTLAQSPLQSGK